MQCIGLKYITIFVKQEISQIRKTPFVKSTFSRKHIY